MHNKSAMNALSALKERYTEHLSHSKKTYAKAL